MEERTTRRLAGQVARAIRTRFQTKRVVSEGVIDSVEVDEHGKVVRATARIDGIPRIPVQVPYGANYGVGARITVENRGRLTSPLWVATTAVSGFRVPDYSEVGHTHTRSQVTDLNPGTLSASSPLSVSGSPLVLDGPATISLDDSAYLLRSGSRSGATAQSQDFGALGILANVISESTSGAGVTIEDVVFSNGGAVFSADVNFATFKAIALSCDQGTTFHSSPVQGQWFYHTTAKTLFIFDGSKWRPIVSFGSFNLYVDGTLGVDTPGQGFSSGSGATKTIAYALDLVPPLVGGDIFIRIAAGTYAESVSIGPYIMRGTSRIYISGTLQTLATGTISSFKNSASASGTGRVNTVAGGSTTVTLSGGGDTSAFWVGAIIKANNISRIVTAIIDSTTFEVDTAVDWYGGGAGYSWQVWQSQIEDSSATWSDDQYNKYLICTNTSSLDLNLVFIRDTIAATKRLWIGGNLYSTPGNYAIYEMQTVIQGQFNVYSDNISFRYLRFEGVSASTRSLQLFRGRLVNMYGCRFSGTGYALGSFVGGEFIVYGSLFETTHGIDVANGGMITIYRSYFDISGYNLYVYNRSSASLQQSYILGKYTAISSIRVFLFSFLTAAGLVVHYQAGVTTAIYANYLGALYQVQSALMAPGYTTPLAADASTYSIAG